MTVYIVLFVAQDNNCKQNDSNRKSSVLSFPVLWLGIGGIYKNTPYYKKCARPVMSAPNRRKYAKQELSCLTPNNIEPTSLHSNYTTPIANAQVFLINLIYGGDFMDGYDNDYLFIDDDLFLVVAPNYEIENDPNYTMIFIVDGDE